MKRTDTVRDQIESWLQENSKVNLYDMVFDRDVFVVDCLMDKYDVYQELQCEFEEFASIDVVGDMVVIVLH